MGKSRRLHHLVLLATLAAACGPPTEMTPPPPPPPPLLTGTGPFVVSNPVAIEAAGAGPVDSGPLTYISLPPGSLPGATAVSIRVERTGTVVPASLLDGGLDPVAVSAVAGDTISLTVEPAGAVASVYRFTVSIRKPPVIVRTRPVKNKRDVPLNIRIEVIFSEPIDSTSLTPLNFELRSGGTPVAGQLRFANGEHTAVEFTPAADLAGATDYQLVLRTGIRDTEGTPLEAPATIPFATIFAPPPSTETGKLTVSNLTNANLGLPNGYGISMDGGSVRPLGVNGNSSFGYVPAGPHTVALTGVAANCSVTGPNPRLVIVEPGSATSMEFVVTCAWTPLAQLAFVRDNQIYLVNSDGTGLVQLTNPVDGVWNDDPAWSPDGQRLAFSRYLRGENGPEIYVMNADGSNVVRRTQGCACAKEPSGATEPRWSPDGRTIAFTRDYDGNESGIYVVDAVGSSAARVLLDSPSFDFHPVWSPDGRQIAFGSHWQFDEPSPWWTWTLPSYDLWIMNADGSGVRPLLEWPSGEHPFVHHFSHSWSPDGRKLALGVYYMDLDANPQVWANLAVMNADGSGLRAIAQSGSYAAPAWSPDGRTIAFGSDCTDVNCRPSIRFVLADGSAEGIIVSNGDKPAWRP